MNLNKQEMSEGQGAQVDSRKRLRVSSMRAPVSRETDEEHLRASRSGAGYLDKREDHNGPSSDRHDDFRSSRALLFRFGYEKDPIFYSVHEHILTKLPRQVLQMLETMRQKHVVVMNQLCLPEFHYVLTWLCASKLPAIGRLKREKGNHRVLEKEIEMTDKSNSEMVGVSLDHLGHRARFISIFTSATYKSLSPEELRLAESDPKPYCSLPSESSSQSLGKRHRSNATAPDSVPLAAPDGSEDMSSKARLRLKMLGLVDYHQSRRRCNLALEQADEDEERQITLLEVIGHAYRLNWEDLHNAAMDEYRAGERRILRTGHETLIEHINVAWRMAIHGSPLRLLLAEYACFKEMGDWVLLSSVGKDRSDLKEMLEDIYMEKRNCRASPLLENRHPYHLHRQSCQKYPNIPILRQKDPCPPDCIERGHLLRPDLGVYR